MGNYFEGSPIDHCFGIPRPSSEKPVASWAIRTVMVNSNTKYKTAFDEVDLECRYNEIVFLIIPKRRE